MIRNHSLQTCIVCGAEAESFWGHVHHSSEHKEVTFLVAWCKHHIRMVASTNEKALDHVCAHTPNCFGICPEELIKDWK